MIGTTHLFPHTAQQKGFSPVWTTTWCSRAWRVVNFLSQTEQTSSLSPVWILSCCFMSRFHWNFFSQPRNLDSKELTGCNSRDICTRFRTTKAVGGV